MPISQHLWSQLSVLDWILLAWAVLLVPGLRKLMVRRFEGLSSTGGVGRALRNLNIAIVAVVLLTMDWVTHGRSFRELGLDWPIGLAGQVGLLLGSILCVVAVVLGIRKVRNSTGTNTEQAAVTKAGLSTTTMQGALAMAGTLIVVSCGLELLYRGFVLWLFTPFLGVAGAVVTAVLIYSAAHGWSSPKAAVGTLGSAFLFTIGLALTHSLWWLMLVHSVAGVMAVVAGYSPQGV